MRVLLVLSIGLLLSASVFEVAAQQPIKCDGSEDLVNPPQCPPHEDWSTYFPVPYDCHKFFQCDNGDAKCHSCPMLTAWEQLNETYGHCNWEEDVGCVEYTTAPPTGTTPIDPTRTTPTPTPEPTTTTTTTTTTPTPTTTSTTTPTTTTTTPTTTTTTTTPKPTTTTTTTTPEPTTTTSTTPEPTTTTPEEGSTTEAWSTTTVGPCGPDPLPPVGECPPFETRPTYLPYAYDCHKFYECSNGVPKCLVCAPRTAWEQQNETYGQCRHEGEIGCQIWTTTVKVPNQDLWTWEQD